MQTVLDPILFSIRSSANLLNQYTADLTPSDWLHRITPQANCAAWIVGHLILVDRNPLKLLNAPLVELPDGFEQRFGRDEAATKANDYGDTSILMPLYNRTVEAVTAAVSKMNPADLAKPLEKPGPRAKTVGEVISFLQLHSAMHAGQISFIRRSLGRPPVF